MKTHTFKKCIECNYYRSGHSVFRDLCVHQVAPSKDSIAALIGSSIAPGVRKCEIMRSPGWLLARLWDYCGKEGRWFKPKERHVILE